MYRLLLNKHQFFLIDVDYKICKVFYNLQKARECMNELNDDLKHGWVDQYVKNLESALL